MKRLHSGFVALALLAMSSLAAAGPEEDTAAQARAYFETGAKEYEKENYPNAIRAFEQAYALTGRPGLLFSIAQSYRRQYTNDSKAPNLKKALEYYQKYVAEDKTGKRKREAEAAIKDIQGILDRLPAEVITTVPAELILPAQISITTQAEDATISIDGGAPRPLEPVDVPPGKYKVVVTAPGYFSEEREVTVKKAQIMALDVQLRPMPALVSITGRFGAEVRVDGAPRGTLPLAAPLEIDAGERNITVSMNGFMTYVDERSFGRGDKTTLTAKMERTQQRVAAFVLFGAGLVSAGTGVASGALAAIAQGEAVEINERRKSSFIESAELDQYENLLKFRSAMSITSTVTLNAGIGLGALAFLLYYFDEPKLTPPRAKKDKKDDKPKEMPAMREMAIVPMATPGFVGVSFGARF